MEPKAYASRTADTKRLWLCFLSKWWIILVITLAGALVGSGLNCLYRAVNEGGPKYKAEITMYIDYATDERDEAYQYFNDYTWKTIIGTDEIMDDVVSSVGAFGKDEIVAGLDAHTPSDIRVMIITEVLDTAEKADAAIKAIGEAVSRFGSDRKEFNSIKVIDTIPATLVKEPTNLVNAAIIGGLVGLLLACTSVLLYYANDSHIRVASDLCPEVAYPFLGYNDSPLGKYADVVYASEDDYADLKNCTCIVMATYKKTTLQSLLDILNHLSVNGCDIRGVIITKADTRFLKRYLGRKPL